LGFGSGYHSLTRRWHAEGFSNYMVHPATCYRDRVGQSRPRKSAQDDKWNFCLTTAIVAVNRRNREQTTPPEPLTGL
jgi:hypothetical protein